MGINLQKGQRIDIGLSKVGVGLGWDAKRGDGAGYDLDASAFMLNDRQKIPSETYFVFYNNPTSPDGAVACQGDDRTGAGSDGDDETIRVDLSRVSPEIQEILFTVTIDQAEELAQNFGQVRNSFIRIYDDVTHEEICKYELGEDFSVETAVEFGRLYKRDGKWRFEASGAGHRGGLQTLVEKYT